MVGQAGAADGSLLLELSLGEHHLRTSASGYEPQERVITVRWEPVNRVGLWLYRVSGGQTRAAGGNNGGGLLTWFTSSCARVRSSLR